MKTESEIVTTYHECTLNSEEMELWDGEPEMYINQGWQEALAWVIGARMKRYKTIKELKENEDDR